MKTHCQHNDVTILSERATEKKMVTIKIRPKDGDWIMGEDYVMTLPFDISITNIKKLIEEERGIHHERSNIFHSRTKKIIEKNRESWLVIHGY